MELLPPPKRIDFCITIFPWSEIDARALGWFLQSVSKELIEEINRDRENKMFVKLDEILHTSDSIKTQIEEKIEDWFFEILPQSKNK